MPPSVMPTPSIKRGNRHPRPFLARYLQRSLASEEFARVRSIVGFVNQLSK